MACGRDRKCLLPFALSRTFTIPHLRPYPAVRYAEAVTEHYFSASPEADPGDLRLLQIAPRGRDLQMWVSDRVFSSGRLDPGTKQLLLAVPPLPPNGRFLDLGCGWGPVAVSAALESPKAKIWAVDVNPRALALTQQNAHINGAKNVRCFEATTALERCQADDLQFDVILSNPPVRIGKPALHRLLLDWLGLLSTQGEAWLVMNKNLGGDSLIRWLDSEGYFASKFSSRKGFRIIRVTRAPDAPEHPGPEQA